MFFYWETFTYKIVFIVAIQPEIRFKLGLNQSYSVFDPVGFAPTWVGLIFPIG